MGLSKWLLKNGPGSPGNMTKLMCQHFLLLKENNLTNEVAFERMITKRFPNMNFLLKEELVNHSKGDLGLFIFNLLIFYNRDRMQYFKTSIDDVIEVVFEVTTKRAKEYVKKDFQGFLAYALYNFQSLSGFVNLGTLI